MKRIILTKYFSVVLVFLIGLVNCSKDSRKDSYLDASLPVEKRVEILLNQMTIEENLSSVEEVYFA
jgi:hypothetical protein